MGRHNHHQTLIKLVTWSGGAITLTLLAGFIVYARIGAFKTADHDFTLVQPPLSAIQLTRMDELQRSVTALAEQIGPRNRAYYPEALDRAATYIERTLASVGYSAITQTITTGENASRNVWVHKRGAVSETIIIGAHYDTHSHSPGADDNASGVAVLLSLAKAFVEQPTHRSLEFVFFANEEEPDYKTSRMGSAVYADQLAADYRRPMAMINLESIGYFTTTAGSQTYPYPLNWVFRDIGDFLGIVSNFGSAELMHRFAAHFRQTSNFPLAGTVLPQWLPGVDWSDQWRFWHRGIPALMVTDSALYRYPFYHTTEDTADKLNYEAMTRVLTGLEGALSILANDFSAPY